MVAAQELPIDTSASAIEMAQTIFGDGVTVVSASYTGDSRSSGIYSDGDSVSPGATPGDTGIILSTGQATSFTNEAGTQPWWQGGGATESNQSTNTTSSSNGINNNSDFNAAAGARTYDAAWIDVDFIPDNDMMTMQFVFSSDEFPEYANSQYQDFVGVWVNGQPVEMSVGAANPGNLVGGINQNLYVDNTSDQYNTEMDGFTVTMTLTFPVTAGATNSIRIGIADVADSSYDSNLLIAGNSVQTTLIAADDSVHLPAGDTKTIDVLANDFSSTGATLTITHINGQAVVAGDVVTLATGQTVQLNADGTMTLVSDGDDEYFNFTYTIDDGVNQDTGFVLVDSIPCFVAGTMIETAQGPRPIETLAPGDRIATQDNGFQPLRWIGRRKVRAEGNFAPIRIAANTFGRHAEVRLSPLHRVLVRDALAELLFGESEVLIAARDLVNDHSVRPDPGGHVEYVHLLFDQHQVVFTEGLASESFLPGPQMNNSFEEETVAEICALFPELEPETGVGYGPSARLSLKRYEAELLTRAQDRSTTDRKTRAA
ncbi:Hint domain-containing protein [Rhodalgimonas zhirmunskyi]|uniref:Hint domain-containing protein n=1 Tax=Rhodalgimonas zhirmunskyi TaxID=2964767 RepID=A0AAJ1X634_9RHOB|nr:Hint domain-containing protein [Rhodoalgimonas zhirmunskyi]MDQ2095858.1 Hint domain-containing protein [Rhodoalgimonas zhirmunskyi]